MTQNPFCDRENPPQWADLLRLAGDRAVILLEDFRQRVAGIAGVVEELRYLGPEQGWAPAYRLGERLLCVAHVLPGKILVIFDLDRSACERVLVSPRIAEIVNRALRPALGDAPRAVVCVELGSKAVNRAFVGLVFWLSRNE
jgi:hypothetical protein